MNIIIVIFIVFQSSFIKSEIVELNNIQIPLNSVTNINRFVYLNNTISNTQKSGLNYSFTINTKINESQLVNRFHIYLIKSDAIPHFDFINNPAICCSTHGGIICDEYSKGIESKQINTNETGNYRLINYSSVYSKDVELNSSHVNEIADNKILDLNGIYYTIFLFCSEQRNSIKSPFVSTSLVNNIDLKQEVLLTGKLYYFNYNGFLSAEFLYATDLYIAITLINTIISVFWIWRLTNPIFSKNIFQKLFTLTIINYLFENLINFHIYNETLTSGNSPIFFEIAILFFSAIKNITSRVIIVSLSLGLTGLEYISILSRKEIDPKKQKRATFILVLYSILISIFYSSIIENKLKKDAVSFLILGAFFYCSVELFLINEIIKEIKIRLSYTSYHNDMTYLVRSYFIKKIYKRLYYVIITSVSLTGIWIVLEMYMTYLISFYKFFSIYKEIWKMNWLIGTTKEISFLILYLTLVFTMYPREESLVKSGTQPDFDEFSNENKNDDFKVLELS